MSAIALPGRRNPKKTNLTAHSTPPGMLNRPWPGRSWTGYVVPTDALRSVVLKHGPAMRPETHEALHTDPDIGWREELCKVAARTTNTKQLSANAVFRRLYDITHNKSRVVSVEMADAICLALGLNMDRDTHIPTLPGSTKFARELVADRAIRAGVALNDLELERLARITYRLSLLILAYPHNTERLQDLAPFDCLRP